MSPWANYTFRVLAWNKIGQSLPSEHSSICTTQPDVPKKNPKNVEGKGTEPNNLVITWTVRKIFFYKYYIITKIQKIKYNFVALYPKYINVLSRNMRLYYFSLSINTVHAAY